ncbi:hypothetical protein E2F47_10730 [Mycobacterium eburneum]|nr:EndoU domain-containing protein [Mycobacterium eburneum]TDH55040.1 hypothetical protein E2F47_10730 [Mycobacterium eburneum]
MSRRTGDEDRPPPRVKGMLGPSTDDDFGKFGGYRPPALRSQIDEFAVADAQLVLDGIVTPEESRAIAKKVRLALRQGRHYIVIEHGGHRHGTGWGKSEFAPGWGDADVIDFTRGIVDNPTIATESPRGFKLHGTYRGVQGVVVVNTTGGGRWYIATAYPTGLP